MGKNEILKNKALITGVFVEENGRDYLAELARRGLRLENHGDVEHSCGLEEDLQVTTSIWLCGDKSRWGVYVVKRPRWIDFFALEIQWSWQHPEFVATWIREREPQGCYSYNGILFPKVAEAIKEFLNRKENR